MATEIVRPGGSVANIGVHGKPVELALNELWIKNIDISMGLVNTNTLGMLLTLVTEHKLPVEHFVTHEFSFDQMIEAYEVFGKCRQERRAEGPSPLGRSALATFSPRRRVPAAKTGETIVLRVHAYHPQGTRRYEYSSTDGAACRP